jgi:hypothetical protein
MHPVPPYPDSTPIGTQIEIAIEIEQHDQEGDVITVIFTAFSKSNSDFNFDIDPYSG